jgi:hypothetical protein
MRSRTKTWKYCIESLRHLQVPLVRLSRRRNRFMRLPSGTGSLKTRMVVSPMILLKGATKDASCGVRLDILVFPCRLCAICPASVRRAIVCANILKRLAFLTGQERTSPTYPYVKPETYTSLLGLSSIATATPFR